MESLENIKTAYEIGLLAGKLTSNNQAYVLNTINALLFSQQSYQEKSNNNITQK